MNYKLSIFFFLNVCYTKTKFGDISGIISVKLSEKNSVKILAKK